MFVTKHELQKQAANLGIAVNGIEVTEEALFSMQIPSDLAILSIAQAEGLDTAFICVEQIPDRDSRLVLGMRVEDVEQAKQAATANRLKLLDDLLGVTGAGAFGIAQFPICSTQGTPMLVGFIPAVPQPPAAKPAQEQMEAQRRRRRFMDLER